VNLDWRRLKAVVLESDDWGLCAWVPDEKAFRALADRTRLRIVNLLARGSLCVCDIQRILGQPQSSVSRHLALLKAAGLIRDRRDGMWTFYTLTPWESPLARGVLGAIRTHLGTDADYRRDLDELVNMAVAFFFLPTVFPGAALFCTRGDHPGCVYNCSFCQTPRIFGHPLPFLFPVLLVPFSFFF
jgi:DNA-binding transcriptional ArsR family regulator